MPRNSNLVITRRSRRPSRPKRKRISWDSILKVSLGAIITFGSSIGLSYFNSKFEQKKAVLEDNKRFEREVISSITLSLISVGKLAQYSAPLDSAQIDKIDSSQAIDYLFKIGAVAHQMRFYVDSALFFRFKSLTSNLDEIDNSIRRNLLNYKIIGSDVFGDRRNGFISALNGLHHEFDSFVTDFHTAMKKSEGDDNSP